MSKSHIVEELEQDGCLSGLDSRLAAGEIEANTGAQVGFEELEDWLLGGGAGV
jgi:hypothetical protein